MKKNERYNEFKSGPGGINRRNFVSVAAVTGAGSMVGAAPLYGGNSLNETRNYTTRVWLNHLMQGKYEHS
jgi:hypothetical protein